MWGIKMAVSNDADHVKNVFGRLVCRLRVALAICNVKKVFFTKIFTFTVMSRMVSFLGFSRVLITKNISSAEFISSLKDTFRG